MTYMKKNLILAVALLSLSSCSQKQLFNRSAPDEFSVLSAQPLTMPPEFRLPTPGEETPASKKRMQADRVNTALLRGESSPLAPDDAGISAGESAFLQSLSDHASGTKGVAGIPEKIEKQNNYLLPRFFGGTDKTSAEVIDPTAERARIAEAKKQGEAITGDGVKSYKESKEGLLQRWFK